MFYLSHLLRYKRNERPATPSDIELDKNREFAIIHSIGVKVTYKRLLRDKVRDNVRSVQVHF